MRKGISPVVAVVLMVALSVIAGVSLYYWSTGMTTQKKEPKKPIPISIRPISTAKGTFLVTNVGASSITLSFLSTSEAGVTCDFNGTVTIQPGETRPCYMAPKAGEAVSIYGTDDNGIAISPSVLTLGYDDVPRFSFFTTTHTAGGGGVATPNWADSACSYRMKLTFNNSASSENLVNFPVLVKLNSNRITYAHTGETDIRFYDADNSTLLNKETELWNSSGDSFIWVKVPQIDAGSTDDYIWAYYDCTNTNNDSPTEVWDSNYKGVWHMTGVNATDSTSNGNNGTESGGVTYTNSGKIDGADEFDGSDDEINCGNAVNLQVTNYTITLWLKPHNWGASPRRKGIIQKTSPYYEFAANIHNDTAIDFYWGNGTDAISGWRFIPPGNVQWDQWNMLTLQKDGSVFRGYVDGDLKAERSSSLTLAVGSGDLTIASSYAGYFNGTIDEVRVSNTSRSADWIKATYLSTIDSMITFGSEVRYFSNLTLTYAVNDEDGIEWVALTEDGSTIANNTVNNCENFYTNTYSEYLPSKTYVVYYKNCKGTVDSKTYS